MKTLRITLRILAQCVAVILRRLWRGPRRPRWNLGSELLRTSTRILLAATQDLGFAWFRGLPSLPLARRLKVRFEPAQMNGVEAVWCRPARPGDLDRTVVYLHGGGYVLGSVKTTHREIVARLAVGADAEVLGVEYRCGPEHPFPAAHEDCLEAYRALIRDGVRPDRVALAGDSAGAALCLDVLIQLRDANERLPAAALLFSPWIDPLAKGGSVDANAPFDAATRDFLVRCIEAYMNGRDPRDPRVAPLNASLHDLPPLLVQVGTAEMMLDQSRALAEAARRAGVEVSLREYEDLFHTFQNLASMIPDAEKAVNDSIEFLVKSIPTH